MSLITVIGRGHSGTRAMSHTLSASGVFMGAPLNVSGDLLPPQDMYDACRVLARYVEWKSPSPQPLSRGERGEETPLPSGAVGSHSRGERGEETALPPGAGRLHSWGERGISANGSLSWDWSALYHIEIPVEFTDLIHSYLVSVRESEAENKGWKIPETTLIFPWIVRMFPEIKYIFWIRNPRDCILGGHLTDDLNDFGIQYPPAEDIRVRRAISWKYQYDLVRATPMPQNWIEVRFEDFVLKQDETLRRLEDFLSIKLAKIPVYPETVGRWKADTGVNYFDFFEPAMIEYGYEIPDKIKEARSHGS